VRTEPLHEVAQRAQIALDLLQGDHVEAPHDLADGEQAAQIALGRVLPPGGPGTRERGEAAQVPGRDQEILVEPLGRQDIAEMTSQGVAVGLHRGGQGVVQLGHAAVPRQATRAKQSILSDVRMSLPHTHCALFAGITEASTR
jgi:hypothetical protein